MRRTTAEGLSRTWLVPVPFGVPVPVSIKAGNGAVPGCTLRDRRVAMPRGWQCPGMRSEPSANTSL